MKEKLKKNLLFNKINYIRKKIKLRFITDEEYFKKRYRKYFGKELNIDNPVTLNEKIHWRILKDRNSKYTEFADKYLVREYVKKTIGEEYLIKLYGKYDDVDQILLEELPEKFVLKCNHDSGSVCICRDKINFDFKKIKNYLNYCLKRNYYIETREWHYKDIKPCILCEELIGDEKLLDYKFHCFDGKVEIIQVANSTHTGNNMYDKDWNLLDYDYLNQRYKNVEKPKNLLKMIEIAEKLSKNFDYIRIDLYLVEEKIYFGEMTFTPNSGLGKFTPDKWDYIYGEKFKIKEEQC